MFKFTSKRTNYDFVNELDSAKVVGNCVISDKLDSLSGQVYEVSEENGDKYIGSFYYNELENTYSKNISDVSILNSAQVEDAINNTIKAIKTNHE